MKVYFPNANMLTFTEDKFKRDYISDSIILMKKSETKQWMSISNFQRHIGISNVPMVTTHLLDLCTTALIKGSSLCLEMIPKSNQYAAYDNNVVLSRDIGGIKSSEDTPTLLLGERIKKYVAPHTDAVLAHFSGGYIPVLFSSMMA